MVILTIYGYFRHWKPSKSNDTGVANPNDVDNLLIGVKDKNFPNYKNLTSITIDDLTKCKDVTNDTLELIVLKVLTLPYKPN